MDPSGNAQNNTFVERKGDCEFTATRTFDAPPHMVYRAWSQSDLFQRWWLPESVSGVSLASCDMDVRSGGKYRLEFTIEGADSMAFYGKYLEVVPNERIVWTNDESEEGAVTTVTFEDQNGKTRLRFHEAYPSKEMLDEALQGSAAGLPEQFEQLNTLLSDPSRHSLSSPT